MSFEDCVYIAKSKCGSKFRITFTPDNDINDSDPEIAGLYGRMTRRECYDENDIRYIYSYYPDEGLLFKGMLACREVDGPYDWFNVILEKEKPELVADSNGRLNVLDQISGEYRDWFLTIDEDILLSMDIYKHYRYGLPDVKVLDIKRIKSTGNYKVKISVKYSGSLKMTTWNLLMDYSGFILKKCICD